MIGQIFEYLTVLEKDTSAGRSRYYLCRCECGNIKSIRKDGLIQGLNKSCGCKKGFLISKKNSTPLNINFFYKDSEELSYFIGLFLSDGYMDKNGYIGIQLKEDDYDILIQLSLLIFGKENITYIKKSNKDGVKRKNQYRLIFKNKEIYEFFIQLGFNTKKTIEGNTPDIYKYNKHFWRGVVDGDGCLRFNQNNSITMLNLVGNQFVVSSFVEYCHNLNLAIKRDKLKLKKYKTMDLYEFRLNGKEALILMHHLYNKSCIHLNRKYKIYISALEHKSLEELCKDYYNFIK